MDNLPPKKIEISFVKDLKLEVMGSIMKEYFVEFIDSRTDKVIHSLLLKIICGLSVIINIISLGLLKLMEK